MKLITYLDSLKENSVLYIDVRSPKEFEESTIPGAINLPIFTNEERAKVGTVYTQQSKAKAKMLGVEIVSPKIPSIIKKIATLAKKYQNIIIFCARGGMRSESIATFCNLAGIKTSKLEGGYKDYRNYILKQLKDYQLNSKLLVIHGFTGVGKTDLLYILQENNIAMIDLEGLANHRGSSFGGIGLGEATNQKMFDSLLWEKLEKLKEKNIIAVEAESKRIGISVLPDFFLKAMDNGVHVLIKSSIEKRINSIIKEYEGSYDQDKSLFIERVLKSITSVKQHLIKKTGKDDYHKLIKLCKNEDLENVVRILLVKYYDPLYQYSQNKFDKFALEISSDDLNEINDELINFISNY